MEELKTMILLSSAFSIDDFSTLNFKQCLVTPKICCSGKWLGFSSYTPIVQTQSN